jgi:hypothetical protein
MKKRLLRLENGRKEERKEEEEGRGKGDMGTYICTLGLGSSNAHGKACIFFFIPLPTSSSPAAAVVSDLSKELDLGHRES